MSEIELKKIIADMYVALNGAYSLLDSANVIVNQNKKAEYETLMRRCQHELGYCEAYQLHIRPR